MSNSALNKTRLVTRLASPGNILNYGQLGRRNFLERLGGGFGGIALSHLLAQDGVLATSKTLQNRLELNGGLHHPAKAKRIIQLFMNGGASQVDTFDYKPSLKKLSGEKFDPGSDLKLESVTDSPGFIVMKSPFDFKQYGQSGRWVSEIFPNVATIVDDLAFLMAMTSRTNVHGLGVYEQNTGFPMPGFPSMGAWVSYGLGTSNKNLPSFVVIPDARGLPYNGQKSFSSGFLPTAHGVDAHSQSGDPERRRVAQLPRRDHPRNGNDEDGKRPKAKRPQQVQSGPRRQEPVRSRRRQLAQLCLPESN